MKVTNLGDKAKSDDDNRVNLIKSCDSCLRDGSMPALYHLCQTIPTNFICGGTHFWVQLLMPNLSHREDLSNRIEKNLLSVVWDPSK